jgi:hypothetical protein
MLAVYVGGVQGFSPVMSEADPWVVAAIRLPGGCGGKAENSAGPGAARPAVLARLQLAAGASQFLLSLPAGVPAQGTAGGGAS